MANAADINLQLLARAASDKLVAAAARNLCFVVFGMDAVFHDSRASVAFRVALKCTGAAKCGQAGIDLRLAG
jgi:hypothetical protein